MALGKARETQKLAMSSFIFLYETKRQSAKNPLDYHLGYRYFLDALLYGVAGVFLNNTVV